MSWNSVIAIQMTMISNLFRLNIFFTKSRNFFFYNVPHLLHSLQCLFKIENQFIFYFNNFVQKPTYIIIAYRRFIVTTFQDNIQFSCYIITITLRTFFTKFGCFITYIRIINFIISFKNRINSKISWILMKMFFSQYR